jgi:Tfp pilus assembly protein PilX
LIDAILDFMEGSDMRKNSKMNNVAASTGRRKERGAALATALIIMSLLSAISMTVLAVVTHESRIAGSDLQRTQTFYAAAAAVEKMTNDFCSLYARTSRPTTAQFNAIAASYPTELTSEGFSFANQQLIVDPNGATGTVTIPNGPFSGLVASVTPYLLDTTATQNVTGTQVRLQRKINNYLVPIFQFGMFSNEDLEVHPGPAFAFNGRVHANGNLYISGTMTFLSRVTTANELVTDVVRNGSTHAQSMAVKVGTITVPLTAGSVVNGPNITGSTSGQPGYFPGSPNGTASATWKTGSIATASAGVANQFGGQVLTRATGGVPLLLPMQIEGNQTKEIIRRMMPNDSTVLSESRYHSKGEIRILIDDENPTSADAAGIPAGQGLNLSTFDPIPLPNAAPSNGGRALWRINDSGSYTDSTTTCVQQQNSGGTTAQALTVRGVKATTQSSVTPTGSAIAIPKIPAGAGLRGRILIQIVDSNGTTRDVTREVLSMGVTEGEPNAIVTLQRPLWAAFTQGSRDASGLSNLALNGDAAYTNSLTDIMTTKLGADGEIKIASGIPDSTTYPYLTKIVDDTASGSQPQRADTPAALNPAAFTTAMWNSFVPINVYNVREGRIISTTAYPATTVYERGVTNIVEINMRNLARWADGVYDTNLLSGTNAISANIACPDGYTVYVSDRRGDRVKPLVDSGVNVNATNGMVDNEDIYGPNNILDPGEDVQNTGALVKDTNELPDPAALPGAYGTNVFNQALTVSAWANLIGGTGIDKDNHKYFRNAVRLFNGENLQISGTSGKLSTTKGITIASENMVYIWGNYNTTGINAAPPDGTSSLNDSTTTYFYLGNQVPTSIVCDAFFPLSKTFYDSETSLYPDTLANRPADSSPTVAQETSVRAAIIAGNNLSALSSTLLPGPDAGNSASGESRLCGGMHNFPRFLESWSARWNFVGSLIPLYHSTQAVGQYNADSTIYSPPTRNWAFDVTFTNPLRLPPGTPLFQHIEPTGFKQCLGLNVQC